MTDLVERLREFAAYGDTGEGRILAQLALTEIKRLRTNVEYWRLAAERRDARKELTGLDVPEARTIDAPEAPRSEVQTIELMARESDAEITRITGLLFDQINENKSLRAAQAPLDPCPYAIDGCVLENGSIGPCLCVSPVAQTRLDASLFNSMQEELTEGHLALDRLGAPREFDDGAGLIRELDIAERISEIPSSVPSADRGCNHVWYQVAPPSRVCKCERCGAFDYGDNDLPLPSTHLGAPHE